MTDMIDEEAPHCGASSVRKMLYLQPTWSCDRFQLVTTPRNVVWYVAMPTASIAKSKCANVLPLQWLSSFRLMMDTRSTVIAYTGCIAMEECYGAYDPELDSYLLKVDL